MFGIENYCDLSQLSFAEIFAGLSAAWEVLPRIEDYIKKQFSTGKIKPNFKDRPDVYIGEGTIVHETADIHGPAIIGKNCVLTHSAFLRGGCLLGDNVRIGHAVEVKHAIFFNGATAAHLNYVGDSIIGNNVNISGGSVLANFRLDKQLVTIDNNGEKVATGLQKFGALLGDNVNIGVNAVLNPGTILGKDSLVFPLVSVTGVYESGSHIKK